MSFYSFCFASIETKPVSCFQLLPSISWMMGARSEHASHSPSVTKSQPWYRKTCVVWLWVAVSYMSSTCLTHFLICQTCSKNVPSQRLVRGGRVYFNTNIYFSFLQFFQEFVTNKHWVHLDIAGVMMNKDEVPYLSKGMSGKKCVCVCVCVCVVLYPWDYAALWCL